MFVIVRCVLFVVCFFSGERMNSCVVFVVRCLFFCVDCRLSFVVRCLRSGGRGCLLVG